MPPEERASRILWIAPKFPLGPPDGARHATRSLIRSLARNGVEIDLVCLSPEGDSFDEEAAKKELGVASCALVTRSASKVFPLPGLRTPLTFRSFTAPAVREGLRGLLASLTAAPRPVPYVLFDGLHTLAALEDEDFPRPPGRSRGIIYRAHNYETDLWKQCAVKARWPWFRWLFRHQAALVESFERRAARGVDLIAPVSEDDAVKLKALAPGTPISVTPIGMDFPADGSVKPVEARRGLDLLFVGRLDWLPNRSGLSWFLEEVWPALKAARPEASLKIAGTGDGRWVEKRLPLDGVEFLGRVESLRPLYEASALSIAPIFQGSGTRVKIIESARYARPVVTTLLGAEGLGLAPGRSYFRAETLDEWLSLLKTLDPEDCRETGLDAFRELRGRFSEGAVAERFAEALGGSLGRP